MRHKSKFYGLLFLFMINVSVLPAGPLVRGYFVEKLPEKATSKALASDKGIVLAHVFNDEKVKLTPGSYKVGVEIQNKDGAKKTYVVSPRDTVETGMMKTFRLAVPLADVDKNNGKFRVFSKVGGQAQWSETYSFLSNLQMQGHNKVTTLYVEAPEVDVPVVQRTVTNKSAQPVFEKNQLNSILKDEKLLVAKNKELKDMAKNAAQNTAKAEIAKAQIAKAEIVKAEKARVQPKIQNKVAPVATVAAPTLAVNTAKTAVVAQTQKAKQNTTQQAKAKATNIKTKAKAKAKDSIVKADVVVAEARKINSNEFKKLKTIDEELIIYVIKEGDTLKSIATKYYGNPNKERAIADLNFIELTNSIKVGEEIIVDVRPLSKSRHS